MKVSAPRVAWIGFVLSANLAAGATLEQMSVEEMSQKATAIVRGRVSRCAGEMRGSVIYTRCTVAVSERWKGQAPAQTHFVIPGGTAQGLVQTFTGTPKFTNGEEYVLFLWAGRSGMYQIIGLSQGKFDLKPGSSGKAASVYRAASGGRMVDKAGNQALDETVELGVAELKRQVLSALAGDAR